MQLHRALPAIREKGATLAFVGNGNRHFAAAFKADYGLEEPVYVDAKRDAYAALGMKRSIAALLSVATVRNGLRALKAGHRQTSVQGDAWQLGGVLVVRPGGEIAYSHLSEQPGDHPAVEAILDAL